MLNKYLMLILIMMCGCGTYEPDYELYTIEVFERPYGPGREHLKDGIDFFIDTFAGFFNISENRMRRKIKNIGAMRFDDQSTIEKTPCGLLIESGLYFSDRRSIFVWWGPNDNCIGSSSLFHEMFHHCTRKQVRHEEMEWHTKEMLDAVRLANETFSRFYCGSSIKLTDQQAEACRRDPNMDGVNDR